MSEEQDIAALAVRMKANGDLIQRIDGTEVVVAHYDRGTGHLEFASREHSVKLYNQVTAKIGTVSKGTQPSGLTIKSIGIKGEDSPKPMSKLPARPRLGPLGDSAEEIVQWYLDNNLTEAIVRYGIYTDANGKPIKKPVRRVIENSVDGRNEGDDPVPTPRKGQSHEGGPVKREREVIELKSAIIARRATALTFVPQEVVGGFEIEDEIPQTAGMEVD